jgi:type IV pilus assembly protein PilA
MTPMPRQPGEKPKVSAGFLAVLIGGGLVLFCCLASMAAVALPNFYKFNKRSKVSEVKYTLKSAFTAERSWFMEKDTYSESLEEIGFMPERGNRYRYYLSARGDMLIPGAADGGWHSNLAADLQKDLITGNAALQAGVPAGLLSEAGIKGTCPQCNVTIIAVGNIDSHATADVWSISTEDRTIGSEKVPAGTPHCHVNDVD